MAASMKQLRDSEVKMQEMLYESLVLLAQIYPPSEQFKAYFKKDMFAKSNKAGFYEVVYYLLNVLNPELTKQKLTSWPPYDIHRESKFRSELIHYITEINSTYENADIPALMTSHLITPSGMKILKFLLRLSDLVMFECLRKTPSTEHILIGRPKNLNSSNLDIYIRNLIAVTNKIEEETRNIFENFQEERIACTEQAQEIIKEKTRLNIELGDISQQYMKMQRERGDELCSIPKMKGEIESLKKKLVDIQGWKIKTDELDHKVSFLVREANVLLKEKDKIDLPDEFHSIFDSQGEFDLIRYLGTLNSFLEKVALHLPHLPENCFIVLKEKVDELIEKYLVLEKRLNGLHEDFVATSEQLPVMYNALDHDKFINLIDKQADKIVSRQEQENKKRDAIGHKNDQNISDEILIQNLYQDAKHSICSEIRKNT